MTHLKEYSGPLFRVQNFIPGSTSASPFCIECYDTEEAALSDYQDRARSIRETGGACEMLKDGERIAATIRPIGGGK